MESEDFRGRPLENPLLSVSHRIGANVIDFDHTAAVIGSTLHTFDSGYTKLECW